MNFLWVSFVTGFLILFSFQNCQKNLSVDGLSSVPRGIALSAADSVKVALIDEKINAVDFIASENQIVSKNGRTISLIYSKTFEIDLATGKILVETDFESGQKVYCLTEELRSELEGILKVVTVCKSDSDRPVDQVCSQVLKKPYAKILTEKNQFELGSAIDGCGTGAVDLCGDEPLLLKGFISHLQNKIESLACK